MDTGDRSVHAQTPSAVVIVAGHLKSTIDQVHACLPATDDLSMDKLIHTSDRLASEELDRRTFSIATA